MPDRLRLTILGCGSSPGVPRITGDWGDCDPAEPRNRRMRTSAMLERIGENGITRVIIDTGPDFREQMLMAGVDDLDAVVYTHAHADHIHGIDDLRGYWLERRRRIEVHADTTTLARIQEGFGYCFATPAGGSYPPIVKANVIDHDVPFTVAGKGGPLTLTPLPQRHGDITSLGFRAGGIAYCPDVSGFPEQTIAKLRGLDLLVVDALQYKTHPSHFSLGQALEMIAQLAPGQAVLTHMHVPLDYRTVLAQTPSHVQPAYDGLALEFDFT